MMRLNQVKLIEELEKIDSQMVETEQLYNPLIEKVHPNNKKNALNLLHYLALRNLDIRVLQENLHAYGLSSMASSESHVRGQLLSILQRLGLKKKMPSTIYNFESGRKSLTEKSKALFGSKSIASVPYIMVTFDTSLADDFMKVKSLIQSGMNVARINCAHDDEKTWTKMIDHVRRASMITGQDCKIYMDLAGPKIRTVLKKGKKMPVSEGKPFLMTDILHMKRKKKIVGCTIPDIAEQVNVGDKVLIDDGLIEAKVLRIEGPYIRLQATRISSKKPFIKNEKGINFPDSTLLVPALTDYDLKCLPFIAEHADLIGYSFVRNSKDVLQLQDALNEYKKIALILKIETPEAVKNFPDLLFAGMREENIGVMIARGDLAVEIGFERMSEIQEEILWICEAAHVPVIWATQVLENLNKSGVATRSEVTDAAHAALADCVMINKGTHIINTMQTLQDILVRSGGHHVKKRFTFRPLAIATRFMTT